ncbi:MAG TPA: sensor histidine kinase [Streptosporangiaceae bacterium]|jgi:signal transduction histidine kinase
MSTEMTGRRPVGTWLTRGLAAAGHGIGFVGISLAETGIWLVLTVELSLAAIGAGLLPIPATLQVCRNLASKTRRLSGQWCGVSISSPYLPPPGTDPEGRDLSFWRRFGWLLTDQATWRDLAWFLVDPVIGWVLTLVPASLIAWGLFGVVMPGVWSPIVHAHGSNWYAFIHVTSAMTAWLSVPLGLAFVAAGIATGPWFLNRYGALARSMLAPTHTAELKLRVKQLAQTRADVVDTGAAELRRIERDLHDGAQARLVAMGMTLSAAEEMMEANPAAARALLTEARDASQKALGELRDLVRGIHPPVLADRGLPDAVRALAMDSPLKIEFTGGLPARAPAPVESAAYFAVCELLTNVAKHAQASQAWIDLRYERGLLRIDVTDDGRGGADPARGTGLAGLERRLAAFDGILAVASPPGGPTVVTMELPCGLS